METYENTEKNINTRSNKGWETLALIIYILAHFSVIIMNIMMGKSQGQIQGQAKAVIGQQFGYINQYYSSSQGYFKDQSYPSSVDNYIESVDNYIESVNVFIKNSRSNASVDEGNLEVVESAKGALEKNRGAVTKAQNESSGRVQGFQSFEDPASDSFIQLGELDYNMSSPKNPNALGDNISAMFKINNTSQVASGTMAQLVLVLSAFITLAVHKKGYITSLILNFISCICGLVVLIKTHSIQPVPGFINTFSAIVLISIIYGFSNKIIAKNQEISRNYQQLIETNRLVKETDEKLSYLAYFDILTGLPNRQKYIEKLDETITNSTNNAFTTILADLDNFKQINDTYGLNVGDIVLNTYAEKLKAYCQENIFLARIGGDEFGFIIEGNMTEANILNHIEKIQNILSEPIQINDIMLTSTSSFGIASYPNNAVSSSDLIKCLDSAIYYAKANGKNRPCFYEQY